MSILDDAESWLRSERDTHLAGTVTYARGASSNSSVKATKAETRYETDDGESIVSAKNVDWLIDVANLTLDASETEPQPGDKITSGGNDYEVAALGSEDSGWRYHGRDNLTYRIHTVLT